MDSQGMMPPPSRVQALAIYVTHCNTSKWSAAAASALSVDKQEINVPTVILSWRPFGSVAMGEDVHTLLYPKAVFWDQEANRPVFIERPFATHKNTSKFSGTRKKAPTCIGTQLK